MAIIFERPSGVEFVMDIDGTMRMVKAIIYHALTVFVQDCKDLVSVSVKKEIARQLLEGSGDAEHAKRRERALAKWLASDQPLAWKDPASKETSSHSNLIMALAESKETLNQSFVTAPGSVSLQDIVLLIIKSVKPPTTSFPAPLNKKGRFVTTLPIALEEIERLTALDPKRSNPAYHHAIFIFMMMKMGIHYVPWHRPPQSNKGPAPRIVSHRIWMLLDLVADKVKASRDKMNELRPEVQVQVIADVATQLHPSAPWSIPVNLQEMGSLWKKTSLPIEWSILNASLGGGTKKEGSEVVEATYRWFEAGYDGGEWKHHMALVFAILFSAILPNVHCCIKEKAKIGALSDAEEVDRALHLLPWRTSTSETHKGLSAREPYITMVSTTILAMMLGESPLREYYQKNAALGTAWIEKHSKFLSSGRVHIGSNSCLDVKYITGVTMVRIGIGRATGPGAAARPKLGTNWNIKSDGELKRLYRNVMEHLGKKDHGAYFAIQEVFGAEMADYAAKKGRVKRPAGL